ncbi:hypothetical protein TRVA0_022S01640 [Trichomonascus vanleenenianus]|uniref:uncharacterized protein n=1 Tax=Trichomonascus vanleenenianus TaxID=2268995 RepID=UPI003ECACC0E
MPVSGPLSLTELMISFQQFMIIWIHCIIRIRKIYPEELFEPYRYYGTTVYRCRHPEVCSWIENLSISSISIIKDGTVKKWSLVILDSKDSPLERFTLDTRNFPVATEKEFDLPLSQLVEGFSISWRDVHEQYRTVLVSTITKAETNPITTDDTGLTFTVLMENNDCSEISSTQPQALSEESPWIAADRHKFNTTRVRAPRTIPIHFADIGPLSFNAYLQEEKKKTKMIQVGYD